MLSLSEHFNFNNYEEGIYSYKLLGLDTWR